MQEPERLSEEDLSAETATPLPAKEVISLLDLNVNADIALDLAAPIDLAVAANLNVAAPVDASASANVLSTDSTAAALAQQQVLIDQGITGDAVAHAPQDAVLDQSNDVVDAGTTAPVVDDGGAVGGVTTDSLLDGNLLDVNVDVALDADLAAPVAGAVAANGNIAAPIDAAVSANVGSVGSEATAIADQTAIINQNLDGVTADATAAQDAQITQ